MRIKERIIVERRKTRQRDSVYNAVLNLNHPTAQEVFEYIIQNRPAGQEKRISLGTVYRNLQILQESGKLINVSSEALVMHYDDRLDPHYHVHCVYCGAVHDIPLDYQAELNRLAQSASDFTITSHALTFEGVCAHCQSTVFSPPAEPREPRDPRPQEKPSLRVAG
jgi:Fe2+ or Zn2+ uptake regulation protein